MSQLTRSKAGSRSGSTLLSAMLAVSVVLLLALVLSQDSLQFLSAEQRSVDNKRAFYLAEAGLAEATTAVRDGQTGRIGSREEPARFGEGLFWVEIEARSYGELLLKSHGLCGGSEAILELVVERPTVARMQLGVFADDDLLIPAGALIDGYDSFVGPYELQTVNSGGRPRGEVPARIASNGDILVQGASGQETTVLADLHPGVEGEVVAGAFAEVLGEVERAEDPVEFGSVRLPRSLPFGDWNVAVYASTPPGDAAFDSVVVGESATLTIQGPARLLVASLLVEPGGSLEFDTASGPIQLFASNRVVFAPGSFVSTSAVDPSAVTVHVFATEAEGDPVSAELLAHSSFHGSIFAPRATIELSPEFELFGCLTGGTLLLRPDVRIHVDHNLVIGAFDNDMPSIGRSWRLEDLQELPMVRGRRDPFAYLGVARELLRTPAVSRDLTNIHLHIEYLDLGGVEHDIDVWEDEFDWSQVGTVLKLKRHEKDR